MTIEELQKTGQFDQYTVAVTHDGIHWFDMGWYISPKKAVAAKKNSPFPPDWKKYKGVKILKRIYTTVTEDITPDDLSVYGIEL